MAGDGTVVPSQSFTSVRNAMLAACSAASNYKIQYSALAIEKELGFWFEKSDYIKIGSKLKIPLEKTWSCYQTGKYQCGDQCLACQSRRFEFAKARVEDKTIYSSNQKTMSWYLQRIQKKAMLLFTKGLKL
jgi:7-cyano-7-deazaguanine synthase in queuosine biosynthesis